MTAGHVIATGLLVIGVAVEIVAVVGVTAMRDVYDRLHYVGLAGFGALLVGASVLVREGFSLIGNKALFAGAFLALFGPVLVHRHGGRSEPPTRFARRWFSASSVWR